MWLALNSSGVVHLFRCAATCSFIHKCRGGNPSVQHEGLIYTFFISYNHHLSPSTLPFLKKIPLALPSTENNKKHNKEKENDRMKRGKVSGVKKTSWTCFMKLLLLSHTWQFTISLPRAGAGKVNGMFPILTKPKEYPLLNLRNKVLSCIKIFIWTRAQICD